MTLETVPEATPATADLICWLWAAYPPHQGHLNVAQIARSLGVSATTLRRWIKDAHGRHFDPQTRKDLARRAILRGRGHYLWPSPAIAELERTRRQAAYAVTAHNLITTARADVPRHWVETGALDEHLVMLVHYERAHVYGISAVRTLEAQKKIERFGEIVSTRRAPNLYAGRLIKAVALTRVENRRCITPRELVPTGRTETWIEEAGPGRMPRLHTALGMFRDQKDPL